VGEIPFSSEEFPANFIFEFLDSPGEGRGRNMTLLSRAAKVQIFAYGKKVPYLMHFHLAANDTRRAGFEQLLTMRDSDAVAKRITNNK
jgi:hypothetical protein